MKREWVKKARRDKPNMAWIWNDTYLQGCYIFWGCNTEQLIKAYRKLNPKSTLTDKDLDLGYGKFIVGSEYVMVFRHPRPSIGLIVHESCHFVNELFDYIGVKFRAQTDEQQAYMMEWTVDRIYKLTRGIK